MKYLTRIGLLALATALGVTAVILMTASLSAVAAEGQVDLIIEAKAPAQVAVDSDFVVNVSYANKGTAGAPDNQVTVILPTGTQFITATDPWGGPFPPDQIDGDTLTWDVYPLSADSTWGHIFIILHADASLQQGELLTTTATIATSAPEPNTENNTTSVTSEVSEMAGSAKRVHARDIMPGDVLTYTINVNLAQQAGGGANGRWVTLTDTLPFSHQVRFLGWAGTLTGTQIDGHKLLWQGQVQAGEPLSLQYRLGVEGVVTPGTVITNVADLAWHQNQMRLGPVTTVVTLPHNMLALGPNQGGQLRHTYGVTLDVPPGAVSDTTRFQFRPFTDSYPITPPGGLLFAHRAFEMEAWRFGESVRQFNRPLTITVGYTDADVAGLKRETLRLWTREGPDGPWAQLGEPARVMSGALAFTTTHFSQFALFAEGNSNIYLPLVIR